MGWPVPLAGAWDSGRRPAQHRKARLTVLFPKRPREPAGDSWPNCVGLIGGRRWPREQSPLGDPNHGQPTRQPLDSPGPWGESPTPTLALQIQEVEEWTQGRPEPQGDPWQLPEGAAHAGPTPSCCVALSASSETQTQTQSGSNRPQDSPSLHTETHSLAPWEQSRGSHRVQTPKW